MLQVDGNEGSIKVIILRENLKPYEVSLKRLC